MMRIAIVGSGISGLTCAYLLHRQYEVVLYESNGYVGGHTNTVDVHLEGQTIPVDTGFIVFNDWTYPHFCGLLDELQVPSLATSMGFSVHCQRCGLEYAGTSLATLFAQYRNLVRPAHYQMLRDIVRFNREAPRLLDSLADDVTLAEFLAKYRYSAGFAEHYLLPMGAAIWSCPMSTFAQFPVKFIIEFYRHHGLLNVRNRPVWRTVAGGSRSYVEAMTASFRDSIRLASPVREVIRHLDHVQIVTDSGSEAFDEVILACHSDQALRMLNSPRPVERDLLSRFPYGRNRAVLHTDTSVLPRRRRVWSSWNYRIPAGEEVRPSVTYNMNILQQLPCKTTVCVTLNDVEAIDPGQIVGQYDYSHPIFTTERAAAQPRHGELIRSQRTSFCGAYWGNGFHEDGVRSALAVCQAFGVQPAWGLGQSRPRQVTHSEMPLTAVEVA